MRTGIFAPIPNYNINQLKRAARCLFGRKGFFENSKEAELFYSSFADSLINYDCQISPVFDYLLPKIKKFIK